MKLIILTLTVYIFALTGISYSQTKKALIIANAEYDYEKTGWENLSSENDVILIQTALNKQGFQNENISVLKNADKEQIINALTDLADNISSGDIVLIHYSGHGQQISDDNDDEIDGLDECIVPINAPCVLDIDENYRGGNHLRDDEFGELINIIRSKAKKNGQVIVLMDACNSGTGTRGEATVRGGKAPLIIPGMGVPNDVKEDGSGLYEDENDARGKLENIAPFILLSGARFDEMNYEIKFSDGTGYGSLSYAFSKALSELKEDDTYSVLYAKILEITERICPFQTPMIEGDIDYSVFNKKTVKQEAFYSIERVINRNKIIINGGDITGLNIRDSIGLYSNEVLSKDDTLAMNKGIITDCGPYQSIVELDSLQIIENTKKYKVFIESTNISNQKLGIYFDDVDFNFGTDLLNKVKQTNPLVYVSETSNDANLIITSKKKIEDISRGKNTLFIKSNQEGIILKAFPNDETSVNEIADYLENYARGKFVKMLKADDPNYKVLAELIPVKPELNVNGTVKKDYHGFFVIKDTLSIEDFKLNGEISFCEDDYAILKITNTGNRRAYFNIIDIQPDGIINPIYPNDEIPVEECVLEPGQSFIPKNFIIEGFLPPYGKEVFKVFANEGPVNLKHLIQSRGDSGQLKDVSPLEKVFSELYKSRGSDADIEYISKDNTGSITDLVFRISMSEY